MDTTPPPAPAPTPSAAPPPTPAAAAGDDKTVAILSYVTLLGFIAAIIIHSNKKTQLGAFHLRQALGLFLTAIAIGVCEMVLLFIPILGWLCILALWISMFVLWLMGLLAAIKGEMKPMPIVGAHYQKWFGNTFN